MGLKRIFQKGSVPKIAKVLPIAGALILILFMSISTALTFQEGKEVHSKLSLINGTVLELQDSLAVLKFESNQIASRLHTLNSMEERVRMKFGLSPINKAERNLSVGGTPSLELLARESLESSDIRSALTIKKQSENFLNRLSIIDSIIDRVCSHVEKEALFRNEYPSIWPVEGRVTSAYGLRDHPIIAMRKFHDGIDIKGPMWTPIIAPADGVVKYVGWRKGYGKTVEVIHKGSGYYTRYAHLADMAVEVGDVVKRGEQIGYLGNTGQSTGPHLHYEIRKEDRGGRTMNPRYFLPTDSLIYD